MNIYYVYQIQDGQMTVQPNEENKIEKLFNAYLNGKSISQAGKEAGIQKNHSSLGRILRNSIHMGVKDIPLLLPRNYLRILRWNEQIEEISWGETIR